MFPSRTVNTYLTLRLPYFSSTTSDFVLRAVPHISDEYINLASKIRIAFTGDPSFFAYNGEEEEPEPEDPDAPPVERFREVHRLAYIVKVSFVPNNSTISLFVIWCGRRSCYCCPKSHRSASFSKFLPENRSGMCIGAQRRSVP